MTFQNNGQTVMTTHREDDSANRLRRIASRPNGVTVCSFASDHQGRRISKTVSNWTSGNWSLVTDHRFLYDGWNRLAVLAADLQPVTSFTWGLHASGTEQGAGGIGGLLSITVHTGTNIGTYFPCYDGNHNVMALVNAATGDLAARYEYGPFQECANSNWNLKCMVNKCNVSLDWGRQAKPLGYGCTECSKNVFRPMRDRDAKCCAEWREKPCPDQ